MKPPVFSSRDLAFCGVFGAAGLLLPMLFHLAHLGSVFMPMYLPLVALGFFVAPLPAAVTAVVTPLLSGLATGMPPYYPPVAPAMAAELAVMAAMVSFLRRLRPSWPITVILIPVLLLGRIISFGLFYLAALMLDLPPAFVAGISFISGWPGVLLMIGVIPSLVRLAAPNPSARS